MTFKYFYLIVRTTGGNSNGDPCVFPFKLNNIIYNQCAFTNLAGSLNKTCCTVSDCDQNLKWGLCPG